jgi:hypothetical protein
MSEVPGVPRDGEMPLVTATVSRNASAPAPVPPPVVDDRRRQVRRKVAPPEEDEKVPPPTSDFVTALLLPAFCPSAILADIIVSSPSYLQNYLTCPISYAPYQDPVIASDGHT